MPIKPLRPCNHPGCGRPTSERFCQEHAQRERQQYEARRGSAAERGYDGTWTKLRKLKLSADPLCERCLRRGRVVASMEVHHKDKNPWNRCWENLESLCMPCHDAEHREERWR